VSGWLRGDGVRRLIPNEFHLANEYKVSQGTVRKAPIAMAAEKLIDRQQGRGTDVARHTGEKSLFHFFRMVGLDDQRPHLALPDRFVPLCDGDYMRPPNDHIS
jgi:DNA-binding transcriptional MocR family regulator